MMASNVNAAPSVCVRVAVGLIFVIVRRFYENTSLSIFTGGKFAEVRQGLGCLCGSGSRSLAFASHSQVPGQDELSWKVPPLA